MPGFVDAHTHAAFAEPTVRGPREGTSGVGHLTSLGDGMALAPVAAVRAADDRALVADLWKRLDQLLLLGTTSVEVKSGYGLTLDSELKQLRAVRAMEEVGPLTVIGTFMGSRVVPPEYAGDPDAYMDLVRRTILPAVARRRLASFCEVACGPGAFSVEQGNHLLEAARSHGLELKVRADRRDPSAALTLAVDHGVTSVERVERATDDDLATLEESGAIGVLAPTPGPAALLPGAPLGRRMVNAGIPVALGSGLGPASGSGADFVILNAPSYTYLPYRTEHSLVDTVVKDGWVVVEGGRRVA